VSPQHSNREALVEGALRCLHRLPPERITARAIADEAGANLASIGYHFGSKDELVTTAAIEGLDRWLAEIERRLAGLAGADPAARLRRALDVHDATRREHAALARTYVTALARAQHDERVRELLAEGFHRTRPELAALLGLGDDEAGVHAGGLLLALFHGLLVQTLLDPALAIEGERMRRAQARLTRALPSD
jgi:AcrR family transcriptional regulator